MDPKYRIAIIIYPGFDELDALAPFEVLSMAADEGRLDVRLASQKDLSEVRASHGTIVRPEATVNDAAWNVVLVPGGGWALRQGAFIEAERGELPRAVAGLQADGARIASVCTGAMVLAAAGLTRGRPATTHPVAEDALRASGAEVINARVVDDGDLITAGPITSGLDLGLWLVERMCGRQLVEKVAERLGYRPRDDVHLGPRATPRSAWPEDRSNV